MLGDNTPLIIYTTLCSWKLLFELLRMINISQLHKSGESRYK